MVLGTVYVLSVPSILNILISTKRSSSRHNVYKRYSATLQHIMAWFQHDIKPGSISWQSLYMIRMQHLKASSATKLKGLGFVSQRDIGISLFAFIGLAVTKPYNFGIREHRSGDWEGYLHYWRVIGYMLGFEDRYSYCLEDFEDTRTVAHIMFRRVITPCMTIVPEYFEHMARMFIRGMSYVTPTMDPRATLYWCRYLADVPGYVYTEEERIILQDMIRKKLKENVGGVDLFSLISAAGVEGLPARTPQLLSIHNYESFDTIPHYKSLSRSEKFILYLNTQIMHLSNFYIAKVLFNYIFYFIVFLVKYFPILAFFRFGFRASYVNMFDVVKPQDYPIKTNMEYYKLDLTNKDN